MRQALCKMQFEIRETARFQAAAETVNRGLADAGFQRQGGNTSMNGLRGGSKDDFRHFAFRFAKVFQPGLDFFQHIHG